MLFSLEALRAKQGDSLLLHYGDPGKPQLIVIDGGPTGVYKDALKPRLEQLRETAGGKLPIELLMVSHIDSDHINGVLELSRKLLEEPQRQGDYAVKSLWHNKFEDVLGGEGEIAAAETIPPGTRAAVASVPEGQRLRDNARGLGWAENKGFEEFVMAPDDAGVPTEFGPLKLTVVGPRQAELDELREKWMKEAKPQPGAAPAAIEPDDSIPNLSSIVCVAELDGKRMLLTGDALGTKVIEGLETAGFLKSANDEMKLDLLKVPHHGSCRNVTPEFFRRLPARHLVISANGKDGNPDIETLEMISEGRRGDDDFTLHLTENTFKEEIGPKIERFFAAEKKAGRKYEVVFRPADELSLRVDLLDPPA